MPKSTPSKKGKAKPKSGGLLVDLKKALNRQLVFVFVGMFVVAGAYILYAVSRADTAPIVNDVLVADNNANPLVVIKSGVDGKCLSDWNNSSDAGSKVAIADCNGSNAQTWTHSGSTFHNNGLCLATAGKSTDLGTNIVMATCDGRATEKWATGNDTFTNLLVLQGTGKCIDSPNFVYANGTQQQLWNCHNPRTQNQEWHVNLAPTCGDGATASPADAKCIAKGMFASYGWSVSSQFDCLDSLWVRESGWNRRIMNPGSGAFGIAQALGHGVSGAAATVTVVYPGGSTATRTVNEYPNHDANAENATNQIRWGLNYIKDRYTTPCSAWDHEVHIGWYGQLN